MVNYNNMVGGVNPNTQSAPIQFPYNNNNMINNSYEGYMGMQQPMPQRPINQNQFLKCRPVSSREEAMAFQIDLDGSLWVFPNVANGKIYTKQINNDGTATFNTYAYIIEKENLYNSGEYVTKDEFNKVIQTIMAAITPATQGVESAVQNNQIKTDNKVM